MAEQTEYQLPTKASRIKANNFSLLFSIFFYIYATGSVFIIVQLFFWGGDAVKIKFQLYEQKRDKYPALQ